MSSGSFFQPFEQIGTLGWRPSSRDVQKVPDKAILITHASRESLGSGMGPIPMPQRHLVETRFGAVVMVFPIAHQSRWGPGLTRLYNRIVTASLIGDQAPLPDCGRPAPYNG